LRNETTRRALLGGAGLASVALVAPVAAALARTPAPTGLRPEFIAAEQAFRHASRLCSRYDTIVYEGVRRRYELALNAVPHVTLPYGFEGMATLTTASQHDVAFARAIASQRNRLARGVGPDAGLGEYMAVARRLLAAHHRRERAIARMPERKALNAAFSRSDALTDRLADLEDAFYAFPARNAVELAHKVGVMVERQAFLTDGMPEHILADARHLAAKEGR
jgi:hypothetical protein